ncbi:MAG: cache domain-containing protein [Actinomycetota bacterium]|nr:cache domain-containing protein [Actinomycetota bacterium]
MRNNAETGGNSWYYAVNEDMTAGQRVVEAGKFDPRTRDWYKAAKENQKPVFSPIYKHFVMDDLTVSAAYPIYNQQGQLTGVLGHPYHPVQYRRLFRRNSKRRKWICGYSRIRYKAAGG